jgi:hypothetical protein
MAGQIARSKSGIVPVEHHHGVFILHPSKLSAVSRFRIILSVAEPGAAVTKPIAVFNLVMLPCRRRSKDGA